MRVPFGGRKQQALNLLSVRCTCPVSSKSCPVSFISMYMSKSKCLEKLTGFLDVVTMDTRQRSSAVYTVAAGCPSLSLPQQLLQLYYQPTAYPAVTTYCCCSRLQGSAEEWRSTSFGCNQQALRKLLDNGWNASWNHFS